MQGLHRASAKFLQRLALISMIAFLVVTLMLGAQVQAQTGESISRFNSDIIIDESGTATITETIIYNFGSNERRGIFREIPKQYFVTDDSGYEVQVEVLDVFRDSRPEPFIIDSDTDIFTTVRIGDENITHVGEQAYSIRYSISPVAVQAIDGFEIVRIDNPGTGWTVPVEMSRINLLNESIQPENSRCYQGEVGETGACDQLLPTRYRSVGVLQPGQTITAEFAYPAGTFSALNEIVPLEKPTEQAPWFVLGIFGLLGAGTVFFTGNQVIGQIRYKQRRKREVVYPRYEPPADMSPAEIGLLIDNSSSGAELSATILQLAVLGYIKIEQTRPKKFLRKAEYTFKQSDKPMADLPRIERDILIAIFEGSADGATATSNELPKSSAFQRSIGRFHEGLKKQLYDKGFYRSVNLLRMSLAARMSDSGYTKWAEVEGFRDFLQVTEKDRLEMLEVPELKPEQFSTFLPYAVALGVEKQWAKQFEHLNVDVSEWYAGSAGAADALIATQIVSSLASDLNGVAQSAVSSGSSGSGGGFSGGGFGGGGGGSW